MIKISIRKMQEVEKLWRAIETRGIVSPFQSYDWLSVQLKRPENAGINFVIVGEQGAEVVFILPMSINKIAGISVCGWSGGKHQNVNKGLYTPEIITELDPSHVKRIIDLITSTYPQTSLFYFEKQPEYLNTYLNIFLQLGFQFENQDVMFQGQMSNDFDQWRTSILSKNSKKSMRRRKRNLLSNYGNFKLVKETSEDGLNSALNAFFEQKTAAQFSRGVPNPFSIPENRNLITDIAKENLQSHHGLKVFCLKSDDHIHAVSLVIEGSTHFSAFANSVNDRSLVFSPGRLIQSSILQHQHSKGRYSFDLGLGYDEYKKEWASESVVLNCLIPINFKGLVLAALIYFKQTILRNLKQTSFGRSVVRRIKILYLKQKA